jgi:uncharacterized delta-60 repeat protein
VAWVLAEVRQAAKRILRLSALATFLVLAVVAAAANPGDLDPTFGSGGKVTTSIGSQLSGASAVVVQPDRKIVVGGAQGPPTYDAWGFGLARFNRDGTLDETFGSSGKVTMPFGTSGEIEGLALQPDHKIVAAGWTFTAPGEDFALARFNPDGSLDPSFGDGGKVTTDFTTIDEVHAIVVQPDGKIVVAGQVLANYALARYRPDGSLDPSFGSGGKVLSSIQGDQGPLGGASALVLQRDGKLVAVGGVYLDSKHQFGAVRFNTDGSLDTTFGSDGIAHAVVGSGPWNHPNAVSLQADGKIVAAGFGEDTNGANDWGLARWNRDGTLDQSFGQGGVVVTKSASFAAAVAVQPNGKIVTAGDSYSPDGSLVTLVRYLANGDLDLGFGKDGIVTTAYGKDAYNYGEGLALQPDGKILVTGTSAAPAPANTQIVGLARFLGDTTCIVPKVTRKALSTAKRAITKARCLPGKVTRHFSARVKKGRIVSQKPGPGASVAAATKVSLVVSKGKRRR